MQDLDAAWRATEPERTRALADEDAKRRQAAMTTVEIALADATRVAAELDQLVERYRELSVSCRARDGAVRRALLPFARSIHDRDAEAEEDQQVVQKGRLMHAWQVGRTSPAGNAPAAASLGGLARRISAIGRVMRRRERPTAGKG